MKTLFKKLLLSLLAIGLVSAAFHLFVFEREKGKSEQIRMIVAASEPYQNVLREIRENNLKLSYLTEATQKNPPSERRTVIKYTAVFTLIIFFYEIIKTILCKVFLYKRGKEVQSTVGKESGILCLIGRLPQSFIVWLLGFAWAIWFIPWQGKLYFPTVFGGAVVQWTSVLLTLLLTGVGLYFAILLFAMRPLDKKNTGYALIGFVLIFLITLGFYGAMSPLVSRISHRADDLSSSELTVKLIEKLSREANPEKRDKIAGSIFILSGLRSPYLEASGSYRIYEPTEKARNQSLENQKATKKLTETKAIVDGQLKQLSNLSILYTTIFFLSISLGILTLIYCAPNPANLNVLGDSPIQGT